VSVELPADCLTPVSAYAAASRAGARSFLLEGVEGGERSYRYSYLGVDPFETLFIRDGRLRVETDGKDSTELEGNPLALLGQRLSGYRSVADPSLPPFSGGAVGYLGYECFRYVEEIAAPERRVSADDARVMVFRTLAALDSVKHRVVLISHYDPATQGAERGFRAATRELERLGEALLSGRRAAPVAHPSRANGPLSPSELRTSLGERAYREGVLRIKEHIRRGDIFQAVLSEQFELELGTPAFEIYRALRRISPTPYLFFLQFGGEQLLGASPEMLARVTDSLVETCPIAGTRPRGRDAAEDARFEHQMLASPKERAEHLMLVDLGRNDVGRIAAPGSVRVAELMKVERYSHVMHLVSLVQGKLGRSATPWDALTSCFPAGTLTGAPKIRACQILAGLEPVQRGPYGGAVLSYGFNGNLDSCIGIRCLYVKGNRGILRAGAGIVADSSPEREYQEVLGKSKALRLALAEARQ
jgi:anthranilate synthase component 1